MEFYRRSEPIILANACWGGATNEDIWDESTTKLTDFTDNDPEWATKFHIWRMDWDKDYIRLYLDGKLLNEVELQKISNRGWQGNFENPFSNDIEGFGHYILLNLAIGSNGGVPDDSAFPLKYMIDFVRVYQK
jgi:beta-glucanase (GH16 family)